MAGPNYLVIFLVTLQRSRGSDLVHRFITIACYVDTLGGAPSPPVGLWGGQKVEKRNLIVCKIDCNTFINK